ncbi:M15 family metallopeptidase [Amphibacillus cookii]|uniref:M15 family metallopeptidase n=1 Tax=Amphibacillus cookii TaxID=767787 RepID=UPI00195CFF1B|nr:M15 family metallopeptidase [Amphibacillus cookii]MBM7540084.1 LAS superfamily LD-carboxypeptidase LdcB [Amphibacillus cookii]
MKLLITTTLITLVFLNGCQQIQQDDTAKHADMVSQKRGSVLIEKGIVELSDEQDHDKNVAGIDPETELYVVDNPDSIEVYVNKQRRLPEGYEPDDLVEPDVEHLSQQGVNRRLLRQEAAEALELLFEQADEQGIDLVAVSGYRSYERQKTIYQSNVANKGQEEADRFSAQPGTSEHQTGLAMDVSAASVSFLLDQAFDQTDEGSWLVEHAHQFGFVIRYPEGKTDITGYEFEPWHLRYLGEELATHLYEEDLTLEEYFGYHY